MNTKRESLNTLSYQITKEFISANYPQEADLFQWTWEAIKEKSLHLLAHEHPSRWSLKSSGLDISSLAAVSATEPLPIPLSVILVTLATIYHVYELGHVPSHKELTSIVETYLQTFPVASEIMVSVKKHLSKNLLEKALPTIAEYAQSTGIGHPKAMPEFRYEVLTDGKKYITNKEDVNKLRDSKNDFDLWWDKEAGEIIVGGKDLILHAQIHKLLELVLEYDGRVLTDEKVCQYIWEDKQYEASRPIDQLFSHLYAVTGKAINKQHAKVHRGLNQRKIDLKIHYCCIKPID